MHRQRRTAPPPTRSDFDYVAVGHVTTDLVRSPSGSSRRPGGGAFYSALQAARLGLRTLILTSGSLRELHTLLEPYSRELKVRVLPTEKTTTLSTEGTGSERSQRLLEWAGPIPEGMSVKTSILHLAPVAQETPGHWGGSADFIGITPQGLTRRWDGHGEISQIPLDLGRLPERYDAVVISETERASCEGLISRVGESDAVIVVTAGSKPITIHAASGTTRTPSLALGPPQDDLGAGDVFAAAFFVALRDGLSPSKAAEFGNAAAAVRIAGVGPNAVGDRAAIEALSQKTSPR
jgi:sugar/nucleoside kinase (ribokinase family)